MATAFEQGRASMAKALPRRNTEQLCFIFSPITLVFSLLFLSVGYGKPSLSCKLINYLFTLKAFFFSLGTVIYLFIFLLFFFTAAVDCLICRLTCKITPNYKSDSCHRNRIIETVTYMTPCVGRGADQLLSPYVTAVPISFVYPLEAVNCYMYVFIT